jgi:TonB family protein
MKRAMLVLSLCAGLAGCGATAERGFMRARPPPIGADLHSPCEKLKQLASINPVYPREAMPTKQDGWVLLQYDVSASGVPFNVVVLDSSPQGVFDQASINAIVQWRYARRSFPTADCVHLDSYAIK